METPAPSLDETPLPLEDDIVDSMSPPHPDEYTSAQRSLAQDPIALQHIHEGIAYAHAQIRLLKRQRDTVQHRMSIHRARLSPVRTIPDQVLQEIFQHCLPDESYIKPDVRSAPLLLTHVCRRWRVVAQGTSELWSSITPHDRGPWNNELEVQMVRQWLVRSRLHPICMKIAHSRYNIDGPCSDPSDVFQLAIARSSQLRDLYLNVPRAYFFLFMSLASLPVLESIVFSIRSTHYLDSSTNEPRTPAFPSAPLLRRIAFHGSVVSISHIPPTVFPQITHLSFDSHMTLGFARLFQDFPNLENLTFTFGRQHLTPSRGNPRLVASSSLLYLCIYFSPLDIDFEGLGRLGTLLDTMDLPGLQTLRIIGQWRSHNSEANHHPRHPRVVALLGRSRFARPRCDFGCPERTEVWVREG